MDLRTYSSSRHLIKTGNIDVFKIDFDHKKHPKLIVDLIDYHNNNIRIYSYKCLDYLLDLYQEMLDGFYEFLLCSEKQNYIIRIYYIISKNIIVEIFNCLISMIKHLIKCLKLPKNCLDIAII